MTTSELARLIVERVESLYNSGSQRAQCQAEIEQLLVKHTLLLIADALNLSQGAVILPLNQWGCSHASLEHGFMAFTRRSQ